MSRQSWSAQKDAAFTAAWREGAAPADMAEEFGLANAGSVQCKAYRLGLGRRQPTVRPTIWTEERKARLAKLWDEGLKCGTIAGRLGVSTASCVFCQAMRQNLPLRYATANGVRKTRGQPRPAAGIAAPARPASTGATARRCLNCSGDFPSHGRRLCPRCTRIAAAASPFEP